MNGLIYIIWSFFTEYRVMFWQWRVPLVRNNYSSMCIGINFFSYCKYCHLMMLGAVVLICVKKHKKFSLRETRIIRGPLHGQLLDCACSGWPIREQPEGWQLCAEVALARAWLESIFTMRIGYNSICIFNENWAIIIVCI